MEGSQLGLFAYPGFKIRSMGRFEQNRPLTRQQFFCILSPPPWQEGAQMYSCSALAVVGVAIATWDPAPGHALGLVGGLTFTVGMVKMLKVMWKGED